MWHLTRDGVPIDDKAIAFNDEEMFGGLRGSNAGTHGSYSRCHFDENYCEVFDSFEDGLDAADWCAENADWLEKIEPDRSEWPAIYAAFQAVDWRHGSCGGCI
jgi:hypothetical protein